MPGMLPSWSMASGSTARFYHPLNAHKAASGMRFSTLVCRNSEAGRFIADFSGVRVQIERPAATPARSSRPLRASDCSAPTGHAGRPQLDHHLPAAPHGRWAIGVADHCQCREIAGLAARRIALIVRPFGTVAQTVCSDFDIAAMEYPAVTSHHGSAAGGSGAHSLCGQQQPLESVVGGP